MTNLSVVLSYHDRSHTYTDRQAYYIHLHTLSSLAVDGIVIIIITIKIVKELPLGYAVAEYYAVSIKKTQTQKKKMIKPYKYFQSPGHGKQNVTEHVEILQR